MSYVFNLPTKVLFGAGKINKLASLPMPGRKALLVISDGRSVRTNGSLEKVENQLHTAGVEYVVYDRINANPTVPVLEAGAEVARREKCDLIIGLGGGSVLDAVTIISAYAPQPDGKLWDYVFGGTGGGRKLTAKPLPYIEITTTAGTGSEVDAWGVVTNPETKEKIGFKGGYAEWAIVDPELMLSVPRQFTAYQGFDALFHSVEGYVSKYSNEMAEIVQLAAIENVAKYLPTAVNDGSNLEARTKVAFANTLSGYSMELGSCTSEHAMEHAMSGHHPNLPHGAGLIMISLPYFELWINKGVCDERFVTMARTMGIADAQQPKQFLDALHSLQQQCGVDQLRMSDYGILPDEFATLARDAKATMGGLFACDRFEMTDAEVEEIYRQAYK